MEIYTCWIHNYDICDGQMRVKEKSLGTVWFNRIFGSNNGTFEELRGRISGSTNDVPTADSLIRSVAGWPHFFVIFQNCCCFAGC